MTIIDYILIFLTQFYPQAVLLPYFDVKLSCLELQNEKRGLKETKPELIHSENRTILGPFYLGFLSVLGIKEMFEFEYGNLLYTWLLHFIYQPFRNSFSNSIYVNSN